MSNHTTTPVDSLSLDEIVQRINQILSTVDNFPSDEIWKITQLLMAHPKRHMLTLTKKEKHSNAPAVGSVRLHLKSTDINPDMPDELFPMTMKICQAVQDLIQKEQSQMRIESDNLIEANVYIKYERKDKP